MSGMKFVLASYGTRGDIEPSAVLARELMRRGHEVLMAVPPDLVGFTEAAGLPTVPYGPNLQKMLDAYRDFWTCFFRNPWRVGELVRLWRESWAPRTRSWGDMSRTLTSLAQGADLLFTGLVFEEPAANVAEYFDIPLVTLHYVPVRINGQALPLPAPLTRTAMAVHEWLYWRVIKKAEDAQRAELRLPKAKVPTPQRITERGSLEIQGYDDVFFPGLASEWAKWDGQRPFVGALTMELPTDADEEVLSWIAEGTPPIYFGFGSMAVESPADTLAMISRVCARLGERALICAGYTEFGDVPIHEHVKVVDAVNLSAIFPACRAVVHHGGAATTSVGLRAGAPTLILSSDLSQSLWGAQVKKLKLGTARRFSAVTEETLIEDLRTILAPEYAARARAIATRMTTAAESVTAAADRMEQFARREYVR